MKNLVFALVLIAGSTAMDAAQDMVLTGVVTTVDDGLPVPGATVSIDSLKLSATTDAAGRYTLTLPAGTPTDRLLDVRVRAEGLLPKQWSFRPAAGTVTHDFALAITYSEEITVGSRTVGMEAQGAVPVDVITARQIEIDGRERDDAGYPAARPFVQLPAYHDRRRFVVGTPGEPARPGPRPGAGPDRWQAPSRDRARPCQRHDGARLHGHRPERHPRLRNRAHRDPARRRRREVRLRRHRRRDQHRAQIGDAVRRRWTSKAGRPPPTKASAGKPRGTAACSTAVSPRA